MIAINDVWAYVFGFFFGRTPLIELSPKKTWEGFIGGGFATVVFGLLVRNLNFHITLNLTKTLFSSEERFVDLYLKTFVLGSLR